MCIDVRIQTRIVILRRWSMQYAWQVLVMNYQGFLYIAVLRIYSLLLPLCTIYSSVCLYPVIFMLLLNRVLRPHSPQSPFVIKKSVVNSYFKMYSILCSLQSNRTTYLAL